jgi:hypothetical protein
LGILFLKLQQQQLVATSH